MKNPITEKQKNTISIIDIPEIDLTGYYKFIDDKIIKHIENACIRCSYEYKDLIKYLKTTLDINSCTFYEGYSLENGLEIEIHHSPFTLYDYTNTVCIKHLELYKKYNCLDIAEEVTKLHYMFMVGLVPLNPTAHSLVHSNNLKIHPDLVIGDWKRFLEEYKPWLSTSVKDKLSDIEKTSKENALDVPKILNKNEIHLQTPFKLVNKQTVRNLLLEKIDKLGIKIE